MSGDCFGRLCLGGGGKDWREGGNTKGESCENV